MSEGLHNIRIAHSESGTGWGGQQIRVVTECLRQIEAGNSVTIICQPGTAIEKEATKAGIPVYTVKMGGITDIPGIMKIYKFLRSYRPDILNAHSSVDTWTAASAARLVGGIKIVRTRHIAADFKRNFAQRFLYLSLCDYITTTGEPLRQQMIDIVGIPPERIASISTGIDFGRFCPDTADGSKFRNDIGVSSDVPLIGTVSMLYRSKGHRYFIEAAAAVAKKRDDVKFVIVGDIPSDDDLSYRNELYSLIKESGLSDRFIMAGFRSDIPNIMAAFDIFVLSSLNEGLPQVLLQALAMRLPVVSTDVGSIPEIIIDGKTGILVSKAESDPIADGILELLSNKSKASELGCNGRQHVESNYSVTTMMARTQKAYKCVLADKYSSTAG